MQFHSHRWRLFQDVVERKKAERLAAIGQTKGMVGHDIRNSLQAITSDVYLAGIELASFPDNEKKSLQESLEAIEGNVEYIDKIVADLQDYAQPLKIATQEVDLEKTIQAVLLKHIPEDIKTTYHVEKDVSKIIANQIFTKAHPYQLGDKCNSSYA